MCSSARDVLPYPTCPTSYLLPPRPSKTVVQGFYVTTFICASCASLGCLIRIPPNFGNLFLETFQSQSLAMQPEVQLQWKDESTWRMARSIHELPPSLTHQDVLSKQLLSILRAMPNRNVSIQYLEQRFGFEWKSFLYQDPTVSTPFNLHDDPFFADMLHVRTVESIEAFLYALPMHLASLPGLHISQSLHMVQAQANYARNVLSSKLVPILCATTQGASNSSLETTMDECSQMISQNAIESIKSLLRQQVSALRALKDIQTKVQCNRSFTQILFEKGDAFDSLATYPPHQLLGFFKSEDACFEELAEFLISGNRRGISGAAGLEPSGSVKEIGIYIWMKRNPLIFESPAFGQLVASMDACASLSLDDGAWHGIRVCDSSDDDHAVRIPMPPLTHCYGTEDMWIVSDIHQCTGIDCALLCTRVIHVLKTLIRRQVLAVQSVKSDLLMASASRFRLRCKMQRSEQECQIEDEEEDDGPVDELAEQGPVLFDRREAGSSSTSISQPLSSVPKQVARPPKTVCRLKTVHVDIPICLERDHAILENIKYFLEQEQAKPLEALHGLFIVKTHEIAERVVSSCAYLNANSTSAASQWISVVCSKLVVRVPDTIELYKRDEKWMHKPLPRPMCACIIGKRRDLDSILEDVSGILRSMQYDRNYSDVWFGSRFSKNRQKKRRFEQKHGETASVSDIAIVSYGLI